MKTTYASICSNYPNFLKNRIFNETYVEDQYSLLQPIISLREYFKEKHKCTLNTLDVNIEEGNKEEFRIYIDPTNVKLDLNLRNYALLLESKLVNPCNGLVSPWQNFTKVFTWNKKLVDERKFIFQPIPFYFSKTSSIFKKTIFLSAISSNKNSNLKGRLNLYQERLMLFRHMSKKIPNDFHLYGRGWEYIPQTSNYMNMKITRILNRPGLGEFFGNFYRGFSSDFISCYRGEVKNKFDILRQSIFNLAFENIQGDNGYITEKIFQPMCCGSIPIYLGADDITNYVPKDCFIDYRDFIGYDALLEYLSQLSTAEILNYLDAAHSFIGSDLTYPFSDKYLSENLGSHIFN